MIDRADLLQAGERGGEMTQLLLTVERVHTVIHDIVWGPAMLCLLLGTGIWMTIRTGFIQVTGLRRILRSTFGSLLRGAGRRKAGSLSALEAVATALASTVGTGNIAGVTGALFAGGPGAVFWMWVAAFFGMATKFAEIFLAVEHRRVNRRGVRYGGPMYYIEDGLGRRWRWLAMAFAVLAGLAGFGIGNLAQSAEIASSLQKLMGVPPLAVGALLALLAALALLGGVSRIGRLLSLLVPIMAALYVAAGAVILLLWAERIPAALGAILRGAFTPAAVGGGAVGCGIAAAMRHGFARGIFSNEAGLGSAPIAHAAAETVSPADQAAWGVVETFLTTMVISTITAMTVLLSGVLETPGGLSAFGGSGAAAATAFDAVLPGHVGGVVLQISLLLFSLTTILGWSYYGEQCWGYLSGNSRVVRTVYRVVFCLMCIVGSAGGGELMWEIADTLNGLMALPNLIALLLLSGRVARGARTYAAPSVGRRGRDLQSRTDRV